MKKDNGFITIMSLTIMWVMLIAALYLTYTYTLEYMIINSTLDSIQSYYFSEGKFFLLLSENKYINRVFPSIEWFIKNSDAKTIKNIDVYLEKEDLIGGDTYNRVVANIFYDYDGRIVLELNTESTQDNITREAVAKVTVINEIYELGIPIVSTYSLDEDKQFMFTEYMDFLKDNMKIPELDKGTYGINIADFEKVNIKRDTNKIIMEYYRNNMEDPIKVENIATDSIFLLCKDSSRTTEISVMDLNPSNGFRLSGIIYVEGNLIVSNDFELNGILIVNGNLIIDPSAKLIINGIVLYEGNDDITQHKNLQVQYGSKKIREYGMYLPEFIDLKIRNIKGN